MNQEIWKDVKYLEGLYKISNLGRVKSFKTSNIKIINGSVSPDGYVMITLNKKTYAISRLVAQAFLGLDINNSQICVCHKDDNPLNNRLDNLFLGTAFDNNMDMRNKGRNKIRKNTILQYTINLQLVKAWESLKIASETLKINKGDMSNCCNFKRKTAGGFIWRKKL